MCRWRFAVFEIPIQQTIACTSVTLTAVAVRSETRRASTHVLEDLYLYRHIVPRCRFLRRGELHLETGHGCSPRFSTCFSPFLFRWALFQAPMFASLVGSPFETLLVGPLRVALLIATPNVMVPQYVVGILPNLTLS